MKFWVGVTDNSWFNYLSQLLPDEVNFWHPSSDTHFSAIKPGDLFLFKLKRQNYIAGGGLFVRHSILPLSLAWDAFEQKNGAADYEHFYSTIMNIRRHYQKYEHDPMIGCSILSEPFFLEESNWIPAPSDWRPNIVRGKTYNTDEPLGAELWSDIQVQLAGRQTPLVAQESNRYGEYLMKARLGQGAFRILVTETYKRRCAITGERTLPVLEAAHIKPYAVSGPHRINNGLLLRSDLHKLFDLGYLTITNDFNIEVSQRIKEEYHNGREYYKMHGKKLISLPSRDAEKPSREYIDWHNQHIYMT